MNSNSVNKVNQGMTSSVFPAGFKVLPQASETDSSPKVAGRYTSHCIVLYIVVKILLAQFINIIHYTVVICTSAHLYPCIIIYLLSTCSYIAYYAHLKDY